jgi:CubicO group peptidase (beta-lactamase class C family)
VSLEFTILAGGIYLDFGNFDLEFKIFIPRELAKFGYLFLNNGVWNGNRIISEGWVKKSTETYLNLNLSWADSYGYLWWLKKYYANNETYQSFFAEGWGA